MILKKKSPFQQTAVKYRFFIYFSFQVFSFRSFYRFQLFRNTFRKPIQVIKLASTSYSQSNSSFACRFNKFAQSFSQTNFKLRFSAQHFSQSNSSNFSDSICFRNPNQHIFSNSIIYKDFEKKQERSIQAKQM